MPEAPENARFLFDLLSKAGEQTYDDTPSALDAVLKEWKLWGSTRTSVLNRPCFEEQLPDFYGEHSAS